MQLNTTDEDRTIELLTGELSMTVGATASRNVAVIVLLLFIVMVVLFTVLLRSPLQSLNFHPISDLASMFTMVPVR